MTPIAVRVRRIYEPVGEDDGQRVLVDRLWPRGVTRASAQLDLWLKEVAPTTELRQWYGHDAARTEEFARRYVAELGRPPAASAVALLVELSRELPVTLLTATRDVGHSGAQVLRDHLERLRGA